MVSSETVKSQRTSAGGERALVRWLSFRKIGAIYVWIALALGFAIWEPNLFLRASTLHAILNEYAIAGLAALSIVLPLAMGMFDLSVGSVIGLTGMVCGWLLTNTSLSPVLVVVLGIGAGLLAGAVNALIVVVLGVDSFIGTLATGALFGAATLGISGGQILTGRIAGGFGKIASINVGGIDITVLYMLILMVALGIFLEHTATGRYSYSVGFNADAARLVGLKVDRYRAMSLLTSAGIAGFAGVVEAAQIQAADPNNGPSYLIPAFSAAFLGATQFRSGRFNPWGAVVAVLLLGTGSVGLLLAGAPQWAPEVFEGVILIAAMSVTVRQKKHAARGE